MIKNYGKGRALKTGFTYCLKQLKEVKALLTVGAHGQHTIPDVEQLIHNASLFSDGIILGVRNFHSKKVPLKNALGNRAASLLFEPLYYKKLLDTQTGLRCLPKHALSWLVKVPGESLSYDSTLLAYAIGRNVPIYEIPIGPIRLKKNSIIYYDEIANTQIVLQQMLESYTKGRKVT